MLNRAIGPKIKDISTIKVPEYRVEHLSNGATMIIVAAGSQHLTSVQIIHKGGRQLEKQMGISKAVARLIKEGMPSMSSKTLSENIDFYGASLSSGAHLDYSYINLFALSKYLPALLPMLYEVVTDPIFPQEEIDRYITNSKERLKIETSKNDIVSYRMITERIFGSDHIYGYNSSDAIYEAVSQKALKEYHERCYGSSNMIIIVGGYVTDEIENEIKDVFSNINKKVKMLPYQEKMPFKTNPRRSYHSADTSQTTLKIGCPLFTKRHQDYNAMYVLNTILGGYFGSRLMMNIREKQGLTYNIYSHLDTMLHDGYFYVSTDVSNENVQRVVDEVYAQMRLLQTEAVSPKELKMVKNYLIGNFYNIIDGPLKLTKLAKMIQLSDLNRNYLEDLVSDIATVEPDRLQSLARTYLDPEKMIEIIVGGSN